MGGEKLGLLSEAGKEGLCSSRYRIRHNGPRHPKSRGMWEMKVQLKSTCIYQYEIVLKYWIIKRKCSSQTTTSKSRMRVVGTRHINSKFLILIRQQRVQCVFSQDARIPRIGVEGCPWQPGPAPLRLLRLRGRRLPTEMPTTFLFGSICFTHLSDIFKGF